MSLRHLLPIALLVAAIPLMGLSRCTEFSARGGCGGPGEQELGEVNPEGVNPEGSGVEGVTSSKSYTFKRGEIGATYNTGSSVSTDYRASTNLGWFLSEGVTLSDSYKTFHPMGEEILKLPPTLTTEEEENLPE